MSIIVVSGMPGVGQTTVSRLVATSFDRSVHLQVDDFIASVVGGWVDPNLPEAERQNATIGAAVVISAMQFAQGGSISTSVTSSRPPDLPRSQAMASCPPSEPAA